MSPRPLPLAISAAGVAAALGYLLGSAGAMDASDDGAPIVYSGHIEGAPAPAALDVEVRVVDSSDGGIVCGPYPVAGVGDDGRFDVELRDCRDAFEADAPLDVQVIIDGETVSTRAVGAVPQAVVAERATGELRAELNALAERTALARMSVQVFGMTNADSGLLPDRLVRVDNRDGSAVFVLLSDDLDARGAGTCFWEVVFDANGDGEYSPCTDPGPIRASITVSESDVDGRSRAESLSGVCRVAGEAPLAGGRAIVARVLGSYDLSTVDCRSGYYSETHHYMMGMPVVE